MQHSEFRQLKQRQTGVVLIVSLLFLMILTLLGISSAKTTVLQEKIVGNNSKQMLAFKAADSCANRLYRDASLFASATEEQEAFSEKQYLSAGSGMDRQYYEAQYKHAGMTGPPRDSRAYSNFRFAAGHNTHRCVGRVSGSSASTVINQGVYQIFPSAGGY